MGNNKQISELTESIARNLKSKDTQRNSKPIFYKRPHSMRAVFYSLAVVTTMIAAGAFYYG